MCADLPLETAYLLTSDRRLIKISAAAAALFGVHGLFIY